MFVARISIAVALLCQLSCGKDQSGVTSERANTRKRASHIDNSASPRVRLDFAADCQPHYAPRPERDPSPMCRVDGGTFWMGSRASEGQPDEHPRHRVRVSTFMIDEFEVTNAQLLKYLRAVKTHLGCDQVYDGRCFAVRDTWAPKLALQLKDGAYFVEPELLQHPADSASWYGAKRYCEWAGKRLPTEAEWEYAARHDPRTGEDRQYPWGNKLGSNRTNCYADECGDRYPQTAPVGTFDGKTDSDGRSAFGVHNMAGNAAEWVADCYTEYERCKGPCLDPVQHAPCGQGNVLRSGSYSSGKKIVRTTYRTAVWPGTPADGLGIRCAHK